MSSACLERRSKHNPRHNTKVKFFECSHKWAHTAEQGNVSLAQNAGNMDQFENAENVKNVCGALWHRLILFWCFAILDSQSARGLADRDALVLTGIHNKGALQSLVLLICNSRGSLHLIILSFYAYAFRSPKKLIQLCLEWLFWVKAQFCLSWSSLHLCKIWAWQY